MKILWIVNTIAPNIATQLGIRSTHAASWIDAMSSKLSASIQLTIVCAGKVNSIVEKVVDNIRYYVIPENFEASTAWEQIVKEVAPDVVHSYGTEQLLAEKFILAYKNQIPIIISLQGIITEYYKHYYGGLTESETLKHYTFRDLVKRDGIFERRNRFRKQIPHEQRMLQNVYYVEGRSEWDRVMSRDINPCLKYYYCPRMIREDFYSSHWRMDQVIQHTILVHQGNYPIKGFHYMVEALYRVKMKYPDTKLYVAGNNLFGRSGIKALLNKTGYVNYVTKLIEKYNLSDSIEYTGYLDAKGMADLLSRTHVCVIPSVIENAPNSLAEAMIVGTPVVASYVGGNAEMLEQGSCGMLYRCNEPAMLAEKISNLFDDNDLANAFSSEAKKVAMERHKPEALVDMLLKIYEDAIQSFKVDIMEGCRVRNT